MFADLIAKVYKRNCTKKKKCSLTIVECPNIGRDTGNHLRLNNRKNPV